MPYNENLYEHIDFPREENPFVFHYDTAKSIVNFTTHWQDGTEILYFTDGEADVTSDTVTERFSAGDIAVINRTNIHSIISRTEICRYYCLITDSEFLEREGIPIYDVTFKFRIRDARAREYYRAFIDEMHSGERCSGTAARADVLLLFTYLCRHFTEPDDPVTPVQHRQIDMVKTAIKYIQENFSRDIDVEGISAKAGFSKYYFCHGFRKITGRTVVDYINLVRCQHAKKLMATGKYNVSESADMCGFKNLSYFTRTYKKHIGELPSESLREK